MTSGGEKNRGTAQGLKEALQTSLRENVVYSQNHNATTNHIFLGLFSPKNDKSVVHENTNSGASPCPFSAKFGGDPPEGCEAIPRASPLGCVTLFR